MRCKVVKNQGSTILKYVSSSSNPINPQAMQALGPGFPKVFLPFTAASTSQGNTEVLYDVTRMITLAEHMRTLQEQDALRKVFGQFKQAIDACLSLKLPLKNLALEGDRVYYDSWADSLRFVYLPFDGIVPDARKIRGFFEAVPHMAGFTNDAEMGRLLAAYGDYFTRSPMFNPLEFASHLGEIAGPTTQVDWETVHAVSNDRKADSATTTLGKPVLDESRIRDRPASAVHAKDSAGSSTKAAGQGAHARVDPGTTVLNALSFDVGAPMPDTTVLDVIAEAPVAPALKDAGPSEELDENYRATTNLDMGSVSAIAVEPEAAPAPAAEPAELPAELEPETEPELSAEPEPEAEPAVAPEPEVEPPAALELPAEPEPAIAPALTCEHAPRFWLQRKSTGERVSISGERFVVGKSKYSTYQVLNTTTVSRSHAVFTCDGESCWIEDDNSRNGTFLDNRRIEPHERVKLEDGAVIRMSDEEFLFSVIRDGR